MTFAGRWVLHPSVDHHADDEVSDTGARYGIAVDPRGRVAVYQMDLEARYVPAMAVYGCLADIPVQMLPDPVRHAAARALRAGSPDAARACPVSPDMAGCSKSLAWFRQMLQGD